VEPNRFEVALCVSHEAYEVHLVRISKGQKFSVHRAVKALSTPAGRTIKGVHAPAKSTTRSPGSAMAGASPMYPSLVVEKLFD